MLEFINNFKTYIMNTFKKNIFLLILVSLFVNCESKTNLSDIQIEKKVNEIIDQMTVDEKVGQICLLYTSPSPRD